MTAQTQTRTETAAEIVARLEGCGDVFAMIHKLEAEVCEPAQELEDYTGCISDAIAEIADNSVSIWRVELCDYVHDNPERTRDAIAEGLALEPLEFFRKNPGSDWESYTAHVGAAAQYLEVSNAIYADLGPALKLAALHKVLKAGHLIITAAQIEALEAIDYLAADDLDDLFTEALEIVAA